MFLKYDFIYDKFVKYFYDKSVAFFETHQQVDLDSFLENLPHPKYWNFHSLEIKKYILATVITKLVKDEIISLKTKGEITIMVSQIHDYNVYEPKFKNKR